VGHIFQLGRKYSEALEARFTNEQGQEEALWMGCYGIGVSRLAQAAVEQHHDTAGIIWPVPIAPFELVLVIASAQDSQQVQLAENLYEQFLKAGVDVLLDDRNERAGVKFKDAELLGIPWRMVIGRGASTGAVELVERCSGNKQEGAAQSLVSWLLERLITQRAGSL
jgi:prolyl-tRNA synthetase